MIIFFNVGGYFFIICFFMFLKDEDFMLVVMFSGWYKFELDKEGRYFIDCDGKYFGYILNYLCDVLFLKYCVVL